jgi:SAM-dependent methyltransferase
MTTNISPKEIVELTNAFEGTSYETYADLEDDMFTIKSRLHDQWTASLKSGRPDYSVYRDPQYNYEGIHCFEKSKACTGGVIKYFGRHKPGNVIGGRVIDTRVTQGIWYEGAKPAEMDVLDMYNGCGLTTAHMKLNGFEKIEAFNDNEAQARYMQHALQFFGLPPVKLHSTFPEKQYDLVLSFEVLEHYTDPLAHVRELLRLVKPGGYLAESSGFNGSSENIGHFDTYDIEGHGLVGFRQARRITTKAIEMHFDKVFDGFNRMPKIWRRRAQA